MHRARSRGRRPRGARGRSKISNAILNRQAELTLVTVLALGAVIAARFLFADAVGVMLLAILPIALLGMMHGFRVGLLSAAAASGAYEVWIWPTGSTTAFFRSLRSLPPSSSSAGSAE